MKGTTGPPYLGGYLSPRVVTFLTAIRYTFAPPITGPAIILQIVVFRPISYCVECDKNHLTGGGDSVNCGGDYLWLKAFPRI